MVKPKTGIFHIFTARPGSYVGWILPAISLLTFIFSWIAIYPPRLVEDLYARRIFPQISHGAAVFADLIGFSWLDVIIPFGSVLLVYLVRKRRWAWIVNAAGGLYLLFFWRGGSNHHPQPLAPRPQLAPGRMQPDAMAEFAWRTAAEQNRLYREKHSYDEGRTRGEAVRRVRRVVSIID